MDRVAVLNPHLYHELQINFPHFAFLLFFFPTNKL